MNRMYPSRAHRLNVGWVALSIVASPTVVAGAASADEVRRDYSLSGDFCHLWDTSLGTPPSHDISMDPGPIGAGNADGTWDSSARLLSSTKTDFLTASTSQPGNLSSANLNANSKSLTIWSAPNNAFEAANALIFYGFTPSQQNDRSDGSVSDMTYLGGDGSLGLGSGAGEAYRCPGGHFCGIDFGWTSSARKYKSAMCQRDYELGAAPGPGVPYGVSVRTSLDGFNAKLVAGIQSVVSGAADKFDGATVTVVSTNVVPVTVAYAKMMYDSSPSHPNEGETTITRIGYGDWFGSMLRFHIKLKISKSGLSDAFTYADIYDDLNINRHDQGSTPAQSFSPFQDVFLGKGHNLPAVPFVPEPGVRFTLVSSPSQSTWGDFACGGLDVLEFGLGSNCNSDADIFDSVWGAVADNNRNNQMISTKFWEALGQGAAIASLASTPAAVQALSALDKNGDGFLGGCDFRTGVTCGTTSDGKGHTVPAPWDLAAAGLWWLECPVNQSGEPACIFAATGATYTPRIALQANFSDIKDDSHFADANPTLPSGTAIQTLPTNSDFNAEPVFIHFTPGDSSKFELVYNSINW